MTLWEFASAAWDRPTVAEICLRLQDHHGQCAPLLLWRAWAATEGRPTPPPLIGAAIALARQWDVEVIAHLRAARRALTGPLDGIGGDVRQWLGRQTKAAEINAERALLEALDGMTPASTNARGGSLARDLASLTAAWNGSRAVAPTAALAAALRGELPSPWPLCYDAIPMDELSREGDPDAALRTSLTSLRQAHQDLDAAVRALEEQATPNQLQIARLKKQKLALRDQIVQLDRRLTPDIIA